MKKQKIFPIAVFARNEEKRIIRCLDSLSENVQGVKLEIFVLVNGCTDKTEELVKKYAVNKRNVHLVLTSPSGKAVAWNKYVYHISPKHAEAFLFMDGDCFAGKNAIKNMVLSLRKNKVNAVSGVPASFGSYSANLHNQIHDHLFAGNLNGLSGNFVHRLRQSNIKLPIGIVGTDGVIESLAKFDLDSQKGRNRDLVSVCCGAKFYFDKLNPFAYFRRLFVYALREYEIELLKPILNKNLRKLPYNINDLYIINSESLTLKFSGLGTFFSWLAIRKIRKEAAQFQKS